MRFIESTNKSRSVIKIIENGLYQPLMEHYLTDYGYVNMIFIDKILSYANFERYTKDIFLF